MARGVSRWVVSGMLLMTLGLQVLAEPLLIGSGARTGVYYQAAMAICQVLSHPDEIPCRGRPTPGSVFNIQAVARGLLDLGIAQSDRLWEASHGQGQWQDAPLTDLRSLFSLHAEAIMLVVRQDSGIHGLMDIRGKRINIGNPGSGHRINADDLMRFHGLIPGEDFIPLDLQQDHVSRALVDGRLDGFFYTVGNPSEAIAEPARLIPIRIISLPDSAKLRLLDNKPYLVDIRLPGGLYPGVDEAVSTLGVKATLVANARLPEETVYQLVSQVLQHLDEIQQFHPALQAVSAQTLLEGLSAPLHPGARRYFEEQGMLDARP